MTKGKSKCREKRDGKNEGKDSNARFNVSSSGARAPDKRYTSLSLPAMKKSW